MKNGKKRYINRVKPQRISYSQNNDFFVVSDGNVETISIDDRWK